MSVVAWDGKSLAVDSQSSSGNLKMNSQKWRRINADCVVAWVGDHSYGIQIADWYEAGPDKEGWPKAPEGASWTTLIVANKRGVTTYENMPVPLKYKEPFQAWGIGRDFALGAMVMGASAKKAAQIACQFDVNCGGKVNSFRIKAAK